MNRNIGLETATQPARDAKGRFGPGNPGKPLGARHKSTQAALILLDGEGEALVRKAVDMALEGDTTALRLCLERISPPKRDAPVQFALPRLESARDATQAAATIIEAVATGELTPTEAARLMGLVWLRQRLEHPSWPPILPFAA